MSNETTAITTQADADISVVSFASLTGDNPFVANILKSDKKVKRLNRLGTVTTVKDKDGVYILLYTLDGVNTYLYVSKDTIPARSISRTNDSSSFTEIYALEKKIWDIITTLDECEILTDKMKDALSTAAMKDVLTSAAKLSSAANEAIKVDKSKRFKTVLVVAGIVAAITAVSIYIDNK